MFAELLAAHGVEERLVLRSRVGFMAFHGGSLERMTDVIAEAAAEPAGASFYAVVQPDDLRWHVPSKFIDPAASPSLTAFLDHVDVAPITLHGYGRDDWSTTILAGGSPVNSQPMPLPRSKPRCPTTTSATSSTASPSSCAGCIRTTRSIAAGTAASSWSSHPGCAASGPTGATHGREVISCRTPWR